MLQISYLRENTSEAIERLAIRNIDASETIRRILEYDNIRKSSQKQSDDVLSEINSISKEIGKLFQNGKHAEANSMKEQITALKEKARDYSEKLSDAEKLMNDLLITLPNTPHLSVPKGKTPEDNLNIHQEGEMPQLPADALCHWDLAAKYNIIDFELGVKLTGAGFPVYRAKGARLQRALINFFLDQAQEAGYIEIQPPLMVNEASGYGTGQLPDKEGQMYHVTLDNLYLIPTAEVPVTNIYRDVILKSDEVPVKNMAYSNCFRREAGSYGKDVRGLNRLHQFDKVEIVRVENPENSYQALDEMREYVATLVRKLRLPFRILKLCGGDMGFTSSTTYDFEVYSAAQKKWLEVSSVSNFESFQANRMKLRIKDADGKTKLAHTLNGSALALPRIVAALLENNQTSEGIKIPEALIRYTGFEMITL